MSNIPKFNSFTEVFDGAKKFLATNGYDIHTEKWQGMEIKNNPHRAMFEAMNFSFSCPIGTEIIQTLQQDINPHLPWAEDHFWERVGGKPINPGEQYKNWPYYINKANDTSRLPDGKYNHNYMERMWPKYANEDAVNPLLHPHRGIRYEYGDLKDVVNLLHREPHTRQAFLPIWFPEDTGVVHEGRVPCTIGYHFFLRHGRLRIIYPIRSCDLIRHFQDDVYLAVRLVLWMLDELRCKDESGFWFSVRPGDLTMHITSLHVFAHEKPIVMRVLNEENLFGKLVKPWKESVVKRCSWRWLKLLQKG